MNRPGIVLVGHADAAVHLDALAGGEAGDVGGLGLGDGDEERRLRVAGVEQLRGLERGGAGDLDLAVKVRGAVLERLEFADRAAELLALGEIVDGHRRNPRRDPDQLRRRPGATGVERAH